MRFLLDTVVLSELRKAERCAASVAAWYRSVPESEIFLSVIVLGEIRAGIEALRPRDPVTAGHLTVWLGSIRHDHARRILPITDQIADRWGRISPLQRLGTADGLIAATALRHGLTVATRNVQDFDRSGATIFNPWEYAA